MNVHEIRNMDNLNGRYRCLRYNTVQKIKILGDKIETQRAIYADSKKKTFFRFF